MLVGAREGPLAEPMVDLVRDLARARGARPRARWRRPTSRPSATCTCAGPDLPETVEPIASIVPAQLMIEQMARRLGLDPDNPRGLKKVTQTDR